MLLLDGVYTGGHAAQDKSRFQRVKAPDRAELEQLVCAISECTGRHRAGGADGAQAGFGEFT